MKRAFTIIELLVASLLLGMLVSVLTMVFNQSSIAWRTGVAGVADLDLVRQNDAEIRDEADNAYIWGNKVHRLLSPWNDQGQLRQRAWDVGSEETAEQGAGLIKTRVGGLNDNAQLSAFTVVSVGSGDSGGSFLTYTVNVKSAGPDREFGTWDDVWSFPDEFE